MTDRAIIVFDGVCNLCNGSVNFILARDPRDVFLFSPVQSALAAQLLKKHGLEGVGEDSFVLVKNGKCYLRSDAVLEISREMGALWPLLYRLRFVPKPIRDFFYNRVAQNRYALFGRKKSCMVPTPELKNRFKTD